MITLCKACAEKYKQFGRKFKFFKACSCCQQKQRDKRYIEGKVLDHMISNFKEPIVLNTTKYFSRTNS